MVGSKPNNNDHNRHEYNLPMGFQRLRIGFHRRALVAPVRTSSSNPSEERADSARRGSDMVWSSVHHSEGLSDKSLERRRSISSLTSAGFELELSEPDVDSGISPPPVFPAAQYHAPFVEISAAKDETGPRD